MPRTLKKTWPLILVVTLIVVVSGNFLWHHASKATAAEQAIATDSTSSGTATTSQTSSGPGSRTIPWVQPVLQRLALMDEHLVALNVNRQQAQSLRATVRDWCTNNKARLAEAFAQPAASRETQLTQALADLDSQVSVVLTASQVVAWRHLRQYQDMPIAYRLAAPNDQQRAKIQKVLQDRWYALRAAKTKAEQQQAQDAFNAELRKTLDDTQMAMIDAYYAGIPAAAKAVVEFTQSSGSTTTSSLQ
jgi:hypothetical protein